MANAIAVHVNCPGDDGDIDMAARHETAFNLFTRQCPSGANVAEVIAIRGSGRKKCAWRVQYIRDVTPQFQNLEPEQLALNIINLKPNNTTIIEKTRNAYPPSIEIVYSCGCRCDMSRNASTSIKRCVEDFVNLKVEENLANLKLEENIQE